MRSISWRRFLGAVAILLPAAQLWAESSSPAAASEYVFGMAHDHSHHDHGLHKAMLGKPRDFRRSLADYKAPSVTLTDMNGVKSTLPDAFAGNTPVLLDFIFTTCTTICPVMSATYAEAQEMLKKQGMASKLVSVSIDPEYDTPDRLRRYAERFGARPEWRLFTGDLADVKNVVKAFDALHGDKANHVPLLIMRRSPDAPWVRIEGLAGASQIVEEVHRMMSNVGGPTH